MVEMRLPKAPGIPPAGGSAPMFESLFEWNRSARGFGRLATFGAALGLHLCVLAAIMVGQHLAPPLQEEGPVHVTFLKFSPGSARPAPDPGPPPAGPPLGPGAGESAELAPEAPPITSRTEQAEADPEPEPVVAEPAEELSPAERFAAEFEAIEDEVVQPQRVPDSIRTAPVPGHQRLAANTPAGGDGAAGGAPWGVPGGVVGGAPGGVPGAPLWAGGDVTAPMVIHRVRPEYPMMARRARLEGEVTLEAVIRRDGTVGEIRVVKGLGLGCTEAAIEALEQWRFRPGERNGVPADVYFTLTVDFILN